MGNRDNEEAVARVCNTGKGVVPSQESGEDTEATTGLGAGRAWDEVAEGQEQEGQVKGEEEEEKGDGRAEGADQEEEGEDEPSLDLLLALLLAGTRSLLGTYHKIEAKRVGERSARSTADRFNDLKTTGSQDNSRSDPKTAVR